MKHYFLVIATMLLTVSTIAQVTKLVQRSTAGSIAVDAKLRVTGNFEPPRYQDTTTANLNKGLDSSGAIIKTNYPDVLWVRGLFPKKWLQVSGGTSSVGTTDYNALINKPFIPAAQVSADWNSSTGVNQILNKPTIPTNTSQLTNGAGFITSTALTPYTLKSDSTYFSTKASVAKARDSVQANVNLKANIASPNFTGTAFVGSDTIATRQYARAVGGSGGGGSAILYGSTGTNTDGSLTQNAVTAELNAVNSSIAAEIANRVNADNLKANLAAPTFSGTVKIGVDTVARLSDVRSMAGSGGSTYSATSPIRISSGTIVVDTAHNVGNNLVNQARMTNFSDSMAVYKANLASPVFTGAPVLPTGTIVTTQSAGTSTSAPASTTFVTSATNLKANLASPTFTGTPTVPTAAVGTNTTQVASTAHVFAERSSNATLNNKSLDFDAGGNIATNLSPTTSFKQDSITVLSDGITIRTVNSKSLFGSGDISHMLTSDGGAHSSTGTASEVTLYSTVIPGNTLGNNGYLRLEYMLSMTNNTDSKLFQVKVGGVPIAFAQIFEADGFRCVTTFSCQNSQILGKSPHPSHNYQATGAVLPYFYSSGLGRQINWAVDNTLVITGTTAATNSLALEDVHLFTYH